ncbi:hypothetical protein [Streptomyces sp. B21-083]|uniref:hypothetical protein n=1 Tax=Streptomyces sp. B21-083 TaxID=3039410 RepID=UPI002FEF2C08
MRCTTCVDDSWVWELYDYGHGDPVATETEMLVGGHGLTVRLPAPRGYGSPSGWSRAHGLPATTRPFADRPTDERNAT